MGEPQEISARDPRALIEGRLATARDRSRCAESGSAGPGGLRAPRRAVTAGRLVAYVRAAADRIAEPVESVCRRIALERGITLTGDVAP